jgi:type III pantothenate kinase
MLIVIDAGNTRLKWASVAGGRLADTRHAVHRGSIDQAFTQLERSLPSRVSRALVANVAGAAVAGRLTALLARHSAVEPEFVVPTVEQLGVRCAYADPARLGADRWVAMLAAYRRAGGAVCVISAGTAVTLDAIDADGRHLGGLILAGRDLQARALAGGTADIGVIRGAAPPPSGLDLLGRSTDEAVGRGAMLALAAAMDRAVGVVAAALGTSPIVFLTGGDGAALRPWLETAVEFRGDLTLEGLALLTAVATPPHGTDA